MPDPLQAIQDETTSALQRVLPKSASAAVLDFPAHVNAGDSLIYLGQKRYLKRLGYDVRYLAEHRDYDEGLLRRLHPTGPIFLQGGGNLGDRWLHTQRFREEVISRLHDHEIVQLPQSIEFREPTHLERAQRVFEAHPQLTLLLRDHDALALARRLFPGTVSHFCPDLAFGVGYLPPTSAPRRDIIMLLRRDSERGADHDALRFPGDVSVDAADWSPKGRELIYWRGVGHVRDITRRRPIRTRDNKINALTSDAMARINVQSARRILSIGRVVVTDRLHAAVLGALMKKPVVVLDNVYGKIAPIHRDYLGRMPQVTFVESATDAVSAAGEFLRAGRSA